MKAKTLLILLAVCVLLGAATYALLQPKKPAPAAESEGKELLASLNVNDAAALTLQDGSTVLRLEKKGDAWRVADRFGYPADFAKLVDFAKKLKEMKIVRSFAADAEVVSRLGLTPPPDSAKKPAIDKPETTPAQPDAAPEKPADMATRATLEDASGKILADVLIGKPREASAGSGGQYVMPAGAPKVALVDKEFQTIDKDPKAWLKKDLLDIPADQVVRVVCRKAGATDPVFVVERPEKGKPPALLNPPEGRKAASAKLTGLVGALASLTLEDVADPADAAPAASLAEAPIMEFHLANGMVYHLTLTPKGPAETSGPRYCRVAVSFTPPPAPEKTETPATPAPGTEAGADKTPPVPVPVSETSPATPADATAPSGGKAETKPAGPDPAQLEADAKRLNETHAAWIYVLPGWKADRIATSLDDYLEAPKTEAPTAETPPKS